MTKQHLLKPPKENKEILLLNKGASEKGGACGLAHQPGFFNPGVGLKFLLWDLAEKRGPLFFLDNDRFDLSVLMPGRDRELRQVIFPADEDLLEQRTPPAQGIEKFFSECRRALDPGLVEATDCLKYFREIFIRNSKKKYLKDCLAQSLLEFHNIKTEYEFVSELVREPEFRDFVRLIARRSREFRTIFNNALVDYGRTFRFRFRNYPFPRLEQNELPFWILRDGLRHKLFLEGLDLNADKELILPRAVTLTLFIRLYRSGRFIHGVGGGNYEWVQDRIIEKFFNRQPPPYAIISGTFYQNDFQNRQFPFFLYEPAELRKQLAFRLRELKLEGFWGEEPVAPARRNGYSMDPR